MLTMLENWLAVRGLTDASSLLAAQLIVMAVLIAAGWLLERLAHVLITRLLSSWVQRSNTTWDDAFVREGVFDRLVHIIPFLVLFAGAGLFPAVSVWIERLLQVAIIFVLVRTLEAVLNAINQIYESYDVSREQPIRGYIQVGQIVVYIIGFILVVSVLLDQSPLALLGGLSAMSAVLLLVFRDTLLGFVGGIQLSMNNMIRIGDWIEMPQYGADGSVLEVNVNTVKVQNWDKTITTIPTYSLVSESFKNWRGMEESGGRRIKRSLNLDMNSVAFCDQALLDELGQIQLLKPYLTQRLAEVAEHNQGLGIEVGDLVNGRHLTNLGTFRAYVLAYLRSHPKINQEMTLLVRQLPPEEGGIPLELYAFSSDQVWANYESIQADIFDHLLAILPVFQLRVFQHPSGADVRALQS